MKQQLRKRQLVGRAAPHSRRGFTLVEVLVVLSILVVLFGLLFAPMMTGMELVSSGRIQSRLQDTARMAAERMRRELANAMYVYPLPTYVVSDSSDTEVGVTDYSQVVFVPAATDSSGRILTPRRPRTDSATGETLVTRYLVKPPDTTDGKKYGENNPFYLVRQEGLYRLNPVTEQYEFGSLVASVWTKDRALSENALTLAEGYDIPATSSICLNSACKKMHVGYVAECPVCKESKLAYLHRDVQFAPERVVGEILAAGEQNTVYRAKHGNWMGTPNNNTENLGTEALSKTASELQPRLVVYRWNSSISPGAYSDIVLDSSSTVRNADSNIKLRWNSLTGEVSIGARKTIRISVQSPDTMPAAGSFWTLQTYDMDDPTTPLSTSLVTPVYPKDPTNWGETHMPISFHIDPAFSEGATAIHAKVVPGSTRVMVAADSNRYEYVRVQNPNQTDLGRNEYAESLSNFDMNCEIRFNRYQPPSPEYYGMPASFDIYLTYYYRTNFDPNGAEHRDDIISADYSTGEIINITLIPQHWVELEPYSSTSTGLVVPPDLPLAGAPVRTQAVVDNARR